MGLDLSLTGTGIVVIDDTPSVVFADTCGFKLKRTATVRAKIERMNSIAVKVIKAAREYSVTVIGIEGFAYAAKGAQNDLGELHGVVKSQILLGLNLVPVIVAPTSARKTVLGKGNFPKKMILDELTKRGYNVSDHNQGDALVVALAVRKV